MPPLKIDVLRNVCRSYHHVCTVAQASYVVLICYYDNELLRFYPNKRDYLYYFWR